jgi:YebC/PmpR family DNA-binding regulatory protein
MAGHSKWSQIKHKKAIADQRRGTIFSKISRQISIAVRKKGPDPERNSKLRLAISLANEANMPKDNIERAIEKASGKSDGEILEEIFLEAYGPTSIALIIKTITDNRNRTISEIKNILNKNQSKLAGEGSVMWLFENVGRIVLKNTPDIDEDLELIIIEAGAQDIKKEEINNQKIIVVITKPEDLDRVKQNLEEKNITVKEAAPDLIPKDKPIKPDEKNQKSIEKLFNELDEHPDVQEIYSNSI